MRTDSARAVRYHLSRPRYAPEIIRFVQDVTGRQRFGVVADIGSGTGISSTLFARCADRIIGIEPNDDMRHAALADPVIQYLPGSAEATGLQEAEADLVIAASCLEWFDHRRARAEFRRILNEHGQAVVLWNHRRVTDPVSAAFDRMWLRHMGPRLGPDDVDLDLTARDFLDPHPEVTSVLQHTTFDRTRLIDFALSSSYAPRPHQRRRLDTMTAEFEHFYLDHGGQPIELPFESVCYVGRLSA